MVAGDYNGDGRDDLGVMYGYGTGYSRMFTWTAKTRQHRQTFNARRQLDLRNHWPTGILGQQRRPLLQHPQLASRAPHTTGGPPDTAGPLRQLTWP